MIRPIPFTLAILLALAAPIALAPHRAAGDENEITNAIAQLSDSDASVRDQAAHLLSTSGQSAEPALRRALDSDDPEVVRRARTILLRLEIGILPDTPQEILDYVSAYRGGDSVTVWTAVHGLANHGNRGLRILVGLRRMSGEKSTKDLILRAIGTPPHEHQGAALLLADGDIDAAASILQRAALQTNDAGIRDLAAFLLLHGGLDDQIAAIRADAKLHPDYSAPHRLTFLLRAKGDLAGALRAADESDDTDLVDSILIESRQWPRLLLRYRDRPANSSETPGFMAAFYRLSKQADGAAAALHALQAYAEEHDEEYLKCAHCLMLNDHVDDGIALILSHKNYQAAMDFFLARLKFKELLALRHKAAEDLQPEDFALFRAQMIPVYVYIGDRESALRELRETAADNEKTKSISAWLALADGARVLKDQSTADGFLSRAMELPWSGDGAIVLEQSGLAEGFPAVFWWRFLRTQHLTEPYVQTFKRLREMASGALPAAEIDAICDAAIQTADNPQKTAGPTLVAFSNIERESWLQTIGQTLYQLGREQTAERCFRRLEAQYPSYTAVQAVGDCEAARGDFSHAAGSYENAWDMDRTRAVPLALHGWALIKTGRLEEGHAAVALAHMLSLGDDGQRTELEKVFRAHAMPEDAARERDLILKTGKSFEWNFCNALQVGGEEQNARGDYLAAADSWELAFLRNFRKETHFLAPIVNASAPAMVHKARALGMAGQSPAAALAEARLAMDDMPADANGLIAIVGAFDAGHKPEADAIFDDSIRIYRQLCQDFPNSGSAHNLVAWVDAKCHRNLDDALKHAQRAVEIEPANTDNIDTLAEVYYARGELDRAVEQAGRCVTLWPAVEHYRQQLERFKAALAASRK